MLNENDKNQDSPLNGKPDVTNVKPSKMKKIQSEKNFNLKAPSLNEVNAGKDPNGPLRDNFLGND